MCGVEAYVDVEDGGAGCFEGLGRGGPRLGVLVMVVRWLEGGCTCHSELVWVEGVWAGGSKGEGRGVVEDDTLSHV